MPRWVRSGLRVFLSVIAIAILTGSISGVPAGAAVHYVDADAGGAGDGTSWADAFTELQDALAAVGAGDEIWVAEGTYYPTPGLDRTATFQLKSGVGIYGGFSGTEAAREERDWTAHVTVLSGEIGEPGVFYEIGDNCYHVVTGSDTDSTAVLDGFTIAAGFTDDFPGNDQGGGIYIESGSPGLINLVVDGNAATGHGGGMYCDSGAPMIRNVDFRGNFSGWRGGGLYCLNSFPSLDNVTFSGNLGVEFGGGMCSDGGGPTLSNVNFEENQSAFSTQAAKLGMVAPLNQAYLGAGMANLNGSNAVLTDVQFFQNYADDVGGGLYNEASNPVLRGVVFSGNLAGSLTGGGFENRSGAPVLTDVIFESNAAGFYGGGMVNGGTAVLTNVKFNGNSGLAAPPWPTGGGAFTNYGPSAQLTNVEFHDNFCYAQGGGIFVLSGTVTLTNVTLAANSANGNGGALACYGGSVVLTNSILWGNEADGSGDEIYNDGATPGISYSLIQGSGGSGAGWDPSLGTDGGNNLDADPIFVDPASGDVRLTLGSPAIGTGDNVAIPPGVTTDLDGNPRIRGSTVDLGPYEYQAVDETAPALSVILSRVCLWPPNHKLVDLLATVTVADDTDPSPVCVLASITSDEPDEGTGPGDLPDDIQDAVFGSLDATFRLRSERMGSGPGRTYTVTYTATDVSGNVATVAIPVCVPHDQSGTALAGNGYVPDGLGFLPKASTFNLVVPSVVMNPGGEGPLLDPGRARIGNHLASIPPLEYRVLDVTGDGVMDLVLEYPTATATQLAELSGPEGETVAFRYEDATSIGRLIPDIFALGAPVAIPEHMSPGGPEGGDKLLVPTVDDPALTPRGFTAITPNPFRSATRIAFNLPAPGPVRLEVYDLRGARMRSLVPGTTLPAGLHAWTWDGADDAGRAAPTGMYFLRLAGDGFAETRKLALMR